MPIKQNFEATNTSIRRGAEKTIMAFADAEGNDFTGTVPTASFNEAIARYVAEERATLGDDLRPSFDDLASALVDLQSQFSSLSREFLSNLQSRLSIKNRRTTEATTGSEEETEEEEETREGPEEQITV